MGRTRGEHVRAPGARSEKGGAMSVPTVCEWGTMRERIMGEDRVNQRCVARVAAVDKFFEAGCVVRAVGKRAAVLLRESFAGCNASIYLR